MYDVLRTDKHKGMGIGGRPCQQKERRRRRTRRRRRRREGGEGFMALVWSTRLTFLLYFLYVPVHSLCGWWRASQEKKVDESGRKDETATCARNFRDSFTSFLEEGSELASSFSSAAVQACPLPHCPLFLSPSTSLLPSRPRSIIFRGSVNYEKGGRRRGEGGRRGGENRADGALETN